MPAAQVVRIRRRGPRWPEFAYIGRPSRWGNPYRIGAPHPTTGQPMTRADVLILYAVWLDVRLAAEPEFLEPLRGKALGCFCYPLPCHGDVIVQYLDEHPGAA